MDADSVKITYQLNLITETLDSPASIVVEQVSEMMNGNDSFQIISVEMTPDEQITALEFIADRFED